MESKGRVRIPKARPSRSYDNQALDGKGQTGILVDLEFET